MGLGEKIALVFGIIFILFLASIPLEIAVKNLKELETFSEPVVLD